MTSLRLFRTVAIFCLATGCTPVPVEPEPSRSDTPTTLNTSAENNGSPGTPASGAADAALMEESAQSSAEMDAHEATPTTHPPPSPVGSNPSSERQIHSFQSKTLTHQWGGADRVAAADLDADGTDELIRFRNDRIHWWDQSSPLAGAIQIVVRVPSPTGTGDILLFGTGMGRGHPNATTQVWRLDQTGLSQLYENNAARNQITDLQWLDGRILLTHFVADKLVSSRFLDAPNEVVHQGPMAMQQRMNGEHLVVGRIYGDAPKSHGDLTVFDPNGTARTLPSLRGVRRIQLADINRDGHPDLLSSDGWHYRYGEQGDARLVVYPGPQWSEPRVLAWLTADYTIREIQELTINNVPGLLLTGSNGLYWTAATSTGWQVEKIATIGETDHATPLRTPQGVTIAISGETIRHLAVSLASPPVNEPSNEASPQAPRHALLLVIDTLRADAIQQANTPHLDQVATRGTRVPTAWSSGTWTVPSVVSLLTGASVPEHGWNEPSGRMGKYPPLPSLRRLPEVLQDAGFKTNGFYANPYLNEDLGFSAGFDDWKHVSDRTVAKQFTQHVQTEWNDGNRHFAYVHILGPHSPVDPSKEAQKRWNLESSFLDAKGQIGIGRAKRNQEDGIRDAYRKGYLGTVEDTDALVGDILSALGSHRNQTVVVITSDHGVIGRTQHCRTWHVDVARIGGSPIVFRRARHR